jgi:L-alanine-DL-glutamate epimerase-like enolase superfamily enzyme
MSRRPPPDSASFVFDENIDDLDTLLRAKVDLAMDMVNLKISKLGGLTRIKQTGDICVSMGIGMTLEDSWGSDIATAAIGHLAHSTPTEFLFSTTDFNSYVTVSTVDGAPQRVDGRMARPNRPASPSHRRRTCSENVLSRSLEPASLISPRVGRGDRGVPVQGQEGGLW